MNLQHRHMDNELRRIIALAVALLLWGAWASPVLAAGSGQYEVAAKRLYFRAAADEDAKILDTLDRDTIITVVDISGAWAEAIYGGTTGYVAKAYIARIDALSTNGKNVTTCSGQCTVSEGTYLYAANDISSDKLGALSRGDTITLRGETVKFYYGKSADGTYGYVRKSKVARGSAAASSGAASSAANATPLLQYGSKGDAVRNLQAILHKLGYLSEQQVTGTFAEATQTAVMHFQMQAGLDMDGVAGENTWKKLKSSGAPKYQPIVSMDWFGTNVSSLVKKRGGTAYIIDCRTNTRINIRRVGGSNHMDVEPLKAEDTEKLYCLYGGEWSWDTRAVILVAGGKYIAASINGMPHGSQISTSNNFDGQFCLHTTGSKTHETDNINNNHQKRVAEALKYLS